MLRDAIMSHPGERSLISLTVQCLAATLAMKGSKSDG